jgi:hypothetical protein
MSVIRLIHFDMIHRRLIRRCRRLWMFCVLLNRRPLQVLAPGIENLILWLHVFRLLRLLLLLRL